MDGKKGRGRSGRARNVISLLCSKLGGKKKERERRAGEGEEEMAGRQEGKGGMNGEKNRKLGSLLIFIYSREQGDSYKSSARVTLHLRNF